MQTDKRFYFSGYFPRLAECKAASVKGFFDAPVKPTQEELTRRFSQDAKDLRTRRGEPEADPGQVTIMHLFELPPVPRPTAQAADAPVPHWEINVGFVCHDVKFSSSATGVFAWPEEPAGVVLNQMTDVLIADALSERGDGPDYARLTEIYSQKVKATSEPVSERYL